VSTVVLIMYCSGNTCHCGSAFCVAKHRRVVLRCCLDILYCSL